MSFATTRRDIEGRLNSNWATTRIAFENVEFATPRTDEAWVRLNIFEENSERVSIGNPGCHRTSGLIVVSVFTPKNTGTQVARDYADTIAEIFRDQQFNGITCYETEPRNRGDFQSWYQYDLNVRFSWDGTYSV